MGKDVRNERRKLTAGLLNASAVATLVSGVIAPSLQASLERHGWTVLLAAAGLTLVLHLLARAVVRGLEE